MYGCLTFLISALLTGVIGLSVDKEYIYSVSSGDDVVSLTTFACRLDKCIQPTQTKFTVHLRGIRAPENALTCRDGRDFLHQKLITADRIQLKNVHDHGYFVLTANVYADGCNVGDSMIEKGFLRLAGEVPDTIEADFPPTLSDEWPPPESDDQPALRRLPTDGDLRPDAVETPLSIRPETTLHDALAQLSATTRPRLPMLILWNDLEHNAFIDRDTPVGIELHGRIRLGQALRLVLRSVSPDVRLAAQEDGGVLVIATHDGIGRRYRTDVYPVADIVSPPSQDREQGGFFNRALHR